MTKAKKRKEMAASALPVKSDLPLPTTAIDLARTMFASGNAIMTEPSIGSAVLDNRSLPYFSLSSVVSKPIVSAADLGALVKASRKRQKLSQQAFADLAGVGRRFVSELEAGKATLELGRVLVALNAAGIDLVAQER